MKKRKLFTRIYIYSLLSVIVVIFFTLLTNFYYINLQQKQTLGKYRESLQAFSSRTDTAVAEIFQASLIMSRQDDFFALLSKDDDLLLQDYARLPDVWTLLGAFRSTSELISSAFILLKESGLIISGDGSAPMEEFFSVNKYYSCYNFDFWSELEPQGNHYSILAPCTINQTEILPVIQFQIGDTLFFNPLVIHIDMMKIRTQLVDYKLTENSNLYIYDYDRGHYFNSQIDSRILSDLDRLRAGESLRVIRGSDGHRYLAVTYRNRSSLLGDWEYIALVPYRDFLIPSLKVVLIPLFIVFFSLILSSLLAFRLSGRIYNPIGELVGKIRESAPHNTGEDMEKGDLEFINSQLQHIISANTRLNREIDQIVPYVGERYLLSVLNSSDLTDEENISHFLEEHGFSFSYSAFCVILTKIDFSPGFFESFTREEHNLICSRILAAAGELSREGMNNYSLSVGADQICTILNFDEIPDQSSILDMVEDFLEHVDVDKDIIRVYSSLGRIHKDLNGLHRSFKEAEEASGSINKSETNNVYVYTTDKTPRSRYFYSLNKENILFNNLVKGNRETVESHFSAIVDKNMDEMTTDNNMKELYLQIYNTGRRVLNLKEVSDFEIMGEDFVNLRSSLNQMTSLDVYKYVELFLSRILELTEPQGHRDYFYEIKAYLDEHYREDISLDQIGESFNITAKYASKLIKKELGMSFQQYISRLRISRAKELLTTTDLQINDIAADLGFNSRHPFLRMFKQYEGITPSEYRKLISNSERK